MMRVWLPLLALGWAAQSIAADLPDLPWPPTPSPVAAYARAEAIAGLGRALFFDPSLSASGRMACATCHDPAFGFSAPNALAVQSGGADLRQPGQRAVPSLMYGQYVPAFSEHFFQSEEEGDDSVDQGPTGGRDWDGRIDRARDQAAIPLLDRNEMANRDAAAVVAAVARSTHAADLRRLYGETIFTDPPRAFAAVTEALEFYQQTPSIFSPFSSKYDAFQHGTVRLTEPEARGLAVFNDTTRGNCAQCHRSASTPDGRPPLFTDFGFVALGLPRNPAIPANDDPAYVDLGLCGPQRHDLAGKPQYCGLFKTPTLRDVARKQSFYHNGVFHTLRDAVAFYADRDTVKAARDLPPEYAANATTEPPFGRQRRLSNADVDDLVAFLNTLTDGYAPKP